MFDVDIKLAANLGVYERLELSGPEAYAAIGCYPAMQIIEHRTTQRTIFSSGEVVHEETYVVDYEGPLNPELVQALADKWNLKIVWRRKTYYAI